MYSTSHTEDFVKEMYTKIGIIEPQQLKFRHVATKLGVSIFYWKEYSQALFLKDYPYIFLNNSLTEQELTQDFFHELGHVLLHSGNQRKMTDSFRRYQENKANHFMYHACIPTFMLEDLDVMNCTTRTIAEVQELFCVEHDFAFKRLEQFLNNRLLRMN